MTQAPHVLVAHHDVGLKEQLFQALRQAGFEVLEARSGEQAQALTHRYRPGAVLLDTQLPDMNGLALTPILRAIIGCAPIIYLAAPTDGGLVHEAAVAGGDFVAHLPLEPGDLAADIYFLLHPGEKQRQAASYRVLQSVARADAQLARPLHHEKAYKAMSRSCEPHTPALATRARPAASMSNADQELLSAALRDIDRMHDTLAGMRQRLNSLMTHTKR